MKPISWLTDHSLSNSLKYNTGNKIQSFQAISNFKPDQSNSLLIKVLRKALLTWLIWHYRTSMTRSRNSFQTKNDFFFKDLMSLWNIIRKWGLNCLNSFKFKRIIFFCNRAKPVGVIRALPNGQLIFKLLKAEFKPH